MQNPLLLLTTSFLAANGMHGTLLYKQRAERKSTISHHAAKSRRTYLFYILGHLVAATSFYLFARAFFVDSPRAEILIAVAGIGFFADIIQAFIPARGEIEKYHAFFAYTMAVAVIIIGVLAAFSITQTQVAQMISRTLAIMLALSIPISRIVADKYFYRIQMISLLIFYLEMFVILFGAK